jgi:CelD/BcsL family acetyltransferase involved in cellulose biosynthesis
MACVREINDPQQLTPLRSVWNELLAQTPRANYFQSLEWLEVYWAHFGAKQKLRVLLVEDGSQVTGILPLTVCQDRTRLGPLRFLMYPLANWGSYYGPIGPQPAQTLAAGLEHIRRTRRDWQALELRWVHPDDERERMTETALRAQSFQAQRTAWDRTAVIDLAGDWDGYFAARGTKWRNNYRRWLRRLGEQGEVRYVRYRPAGEDAGESEPRWDLYEQCEQIAQNSWQGSSTTGTTLTHADVRSYLRDAHSAACRAGCADINLLYIGGQPAAFAYNYCYQGYVFGLRVGYDPAAGRDGIGNVLYMHAIQDCFARGDRIYDMGPGSLEIKRQLLTRIETVWRYSHFPLTPRGQLLRARRWMEGRSSQWETEKSGEQRTEARNSVPSTQN